MHVARRTFLASSIAGMVTPALSASARRRFPDGFLWGAATAGHQVEGNNINADTWLLENIKPTLYAERSGDADNSFELWPADMDIARKIGLNSYRFSLEWCRIEPDKGHFSLAMLEHYRRMIAGCRERGLTPVVTFNHFTTPAWFARQGGWTNPESVELFVRYCDKAARYLADHIGMATTLNEPNLLRLQAITAPPIRTEQRRKMLEAAARSAEVEKYAAGNAANPEDFDTIAKNQIAAHTRGRIAIKSVKPDLRVGVSLAMVDDQAAPGGEARRDEVRSRAYNEWLEAARGDDFVGVQNYERNVWGSLGKMPPTPGTERNAFGGEVFPGSLAGAVQYAYQVSRAPILVTEHGVVTKDDRIRAHFIPEALQALRNVMDSGVPVLGYIHWTLLDNFEWSLGYWPTFGLVAVDRTTFKRSIKPSAAILGSIARHNAI